MKFNQHFDLKGRHSFLSASQYSWVNYTDEKLDARYLTAMAAQRGTALHELAQQAITLGVKLPRNKNTLNQYVNDAIGFRMKPEQVLFYSPNAFGTADSISFRNDFLRIHDLKTGTTPTHMTQLKVYEAFFCLEYSYKPSEIEAELRIYQDNDYVVERPDSEEIVYIMDKIINFDKRINAIKELQ